jgi:diguanylate cyclase (GGDEF)-like protein
MRIPIVPKKAAPDGGPLAVVPYVWSLADDVLTFQGRPAGAAVALAGIDSGRALADRIVDRDRARRQALLSLHIAQGTPFDGHWSLLGDDGTTLFVHESACAVPAEPGRHPAQIHGMLRLATAGELAAQPSVDALTGLPNRAALTALFDTAIRQAARDGKTGLFAVVGIDNMSLINEAWGVAVADRVIAATGSRIGGLIRKNDSFGRTGGDSFGLILADCPEAMLPRIADKLLEGFHGDALRTVDGTFPISVSLGVVPFPGDLPSAAEGLVRAESALRRAKHRGHDSWAAAPSADVRRAESRRTLATGTAFVDAARDDRLFFAYQPVIATADGLAAYHECLLRMRMPDGGVMAAGAFIPIVERLGFARLLDRHTLHLAMRDLVRHPSHRLAVNISALTTADRGWIELLTSLLARRRDVAERLIVEMTETAALRDVEETMRFLEGVRALGCRTSLDDFGAGHTAFRHLTALPFDIVKLDGSLTERLGTEPARQAVVRSIVAFAHSLGRSVVAECIESLDDVARLRDVGVDYLQGYFLGAPKPHYTE